MYAVPTSKGWLTVTCELNADAGTEAATSCDRVAATMRPTGARAVHPGPDRAYARGLAAVVTTLDRRVAARSGDLAAKRITRRAATAAGLAPAYSDAARRIRSLPVPPHDRALNTNLARASDRVGSALGDLATAAQRRNRPAYNRARSAVAVADAQLARAFTELEAAGYAVK